MLVPRGVHGYASSTAEAVLDHASAGARLARFADLDDQVEACRRVFASDTRWTVVRGSDLQEGESQGLPVWSRHVGDPVLKSNLTRRVDFAPFMVEALENDAPRERTANLDAWRSCPQTPPKQWRYGTCTSLPGRSRIGIARPRRGTASDSPRTLSAIGARLRALRLPEVAGC